MNYKEFILRNGLKPVSKVNSVRYPQQRRLLDTLRQDDYALIVFDALRYDYAQWVLPLYLEGELQPVWSAGHDTFEYGAKCWGDSVYEDRYVSGAIPFNKQESFEDAFLQELYGTWKPKDYLPNLVEAWREAWDTSLGTTRPEKVTEIAEKCVGAEKLVTHYFQPHAPYIGRDSLLGHVNNESANPFAGEPVDKPLWELVKSGQIDIERLQLAYESNIHRGVQAALPLIKELCEQERRVVVMADHGELLGEYHRKLVSHPRISFPQIRKVPWMEVKGVKEYPEGSALDAESVEEKLQALGYV